MSPLAIWTVIPLGAIWLWYVSAFGWIVGTVAYVATWGVIGLGVVVMEFGVKGGRR